MLTKNQAIEAVRKKLPDDFDIYLDSIIEKEYGWVIISNTKRYIETNEFVFKAIGTGFLVEKHTGRLIEFGGAQSTEEFLKSYELGYLAHDDFDLLITEISNLEEATKLIVRLGIRYVKPEVEGGTTWRIPKFYSTQRLRERLNHLPCRFNLGSLHFDWRGIEQMKRSTSLKFELVANAGLRNEI